MMLHTKTFVLRYFQLNLHIEAQISSGVLILHGQLPHVEPCSAGDNSIFLAVQTIEQYGPGDKQYGFLSNCS